MVPSDFNFCEIISWTISSRKNSPFINCFANILGPKGKNIHTQGVYLYYILHDLIVWINWQEIQNYSFLSFAFFKTLFNPSPSLILQLIIGPKYKNICKKIRFWPDRSDKLELNPLYREILLINDLDLVTIIWIHFFSTFTSFDEPPSNHFWTCYPDYPVVCYSAYMVIPFSFLLQYSLVYPFRHTCYSDIVSSYSICECVIHCSP